MSNFNEITKDFVKWLDTLDEDSIIRIQQKEIEKLHSIIKEVREILEKEYVQVNNKEYNLDWNDLENIIKEILDKVGETDDSKRNV